MHQNNSILGRYIDMQNCAYYISRISGYGDYLSRSFHRRGDVIVFMGGITHMITRGCLSPTEIFARADEVPFSYMLIRDNEMVYVRLGTAINGISCKSIARTREDFTITDSNCNNVRFGISVYTIGDESYVIYNNQMNMQQVLFPFLYFMQYKAYYHVLVCIVTVMLSFIHPYTYICALLPSVFIYYKGEQMMTSFLRRRKANLILTVLSRSTCVLDKILPEPLRCNG